MPNKICNAFNTPGGCEFGTKCRYLHKLSVGSTKDQLCQSVLRGFECDYGAGCKFSHDVTKVLTTTRLFFKGGNAKHQAALQAILEFKARNLKTEEDKQMLFGQHAESILEMITTSVDVKSKSTEEVSRVLWVLVAESKLGDESTGLIEIVQYILNDPSLRTSLEAKISKYLENHKIPSFSAKSKLIRLKEIFEEISHTSSIEAVTLSPQLLTELKKCSGNQATSAAPRTAGAASRAVARTAALRPAGAVLRAEHKIQSAVTSSPVGTKGEKHVPARHIQAILDMPITPEMQIGMIKTLISS